MGVWFPKAENCIFNLEILFLTWNFQNQKFQHRMFLFDQSSRSTRQWARRKPRSVSMVIMAQVILTIFHLGDAPWSPPVTPTLEISFSRRQLFDWSRTLISSHETQLLNIILMNVTWP